VVVAELEHKDIQVQVAVEELVLLEVTAIQTVLQDIQVHTVEMVVQVFLYLVHFMQVAAEVIALLDTVVKLKDQT
jgi:hypothetical protein